jgi:hypothetical protein
VKGGKFPDNYISAPYKMRQLGGGWFVDEFPAIGGETIHGPYRTRKRARWARNGLRKRAKGSGAQLDRRFWA